MLAFLCSSYAPFGAYAADDQQEKVLYGYNRQNTYESYIQKYRDDAIPINEIIVPANSFSNFSDADVSIIDGAEGKDNVVKWTNESGWVEWTVDVAETGLYNIAIGYYPLEGKGKDIELSLEIDGTAPFSSAINCLLPRIWKDETEIKVDVKGNDLRPRQVENPMWSESILNDSEGLNGGSYKFHFTSGKHIIRLYARCEALLLDYIKIFNEAEIPGYMQVYEGYMKNGYKNAASPDLKIQAESAYLKSDSVLYPIYDRSSPSTEPYHPSKIRMNTIGGYNWKYAGQWLKWQITVPESGLYNIGIKYRQNIVRGIYTNRKITIDGKTPFKELEDIKFPYGVEWQLKILGDNNPYLIYLQKGTHEIGMEVVMGDISEALSVIENCVYKLNYLYRKIIMITSLNPDKNRDYYLDREVPGLMSNLDSISSMLDNESKRIEKLTGRKGSEASQLEQVSAEIKSLVENPDTISTRLINLKSNISSLSTWILTLKEQPLEIDYIIVQAPGKHFPKPNAGFWGNLVHEIKAFFATFTEDYNSFDNINENEQALNVWISGGRDQAQIVRDMLDSSFTPSTNIKVKLNLVTTGIVEATLAGRGPDVHLNIAKADPVNLAMRGALADLSQFSDFNDIRKRFYNSAMVPYNFQNKYYALPVQQNFSMMFYRIDIFDELGIKPPRTWNDFYKVIPVIQRNNMGIGIPASPSVFITLLLQNGMTLYNEDLTGTMLDQPIAIDTFKQWTGLYTDYSLDLTFDFYNRFRSGEMPIGIASYTFFNQLSVAAPEIRGLWEMLPVPGVESPDGSINRAENADGTATIILKNTKNKEAAWKLLKWWTSDEVQSLYGQELENIMGPAARYDTANKGAFEKLPWSNKEYNNLSEQWKYVTEVPELPGSYYTTRCLEFAFRSVTYFQKGKILKNPREQLYINNRYINEEIQRKRIEFGLEKSK